MKKIVLGILLSLLLSIPISADDRGTPEEPEITVFVKAPRSVEVTSNMIFLIDCSYSMGKTDRFKIAIREFGAVIMGANDDGMFSLIAFKALLKDMEFWPGYIEKDEVENNKPPKGWAKLPSFTALKAANKWLNSVHCSDFTDMSTVIKKAFRLNKNRENLTIILFTDGNNTYPNFNGEKPSEVAKIIEGLNKERAKNKKDRIRIFVFGVSMEQNVAMLKAIAIAGGGAYITSDKVCPVCIKNVKDVPEVQRVHRVSHF